MLRYVDVSLVQNFSQSIRRRDLRLLVLPMTMVFLAGAALDDDLAGVDGLMEDISRVTLGPPWLLSPVNHW